jgi:Holliday junction resolvase RusA-like endonuclease
MSPRRTTRPKRPAPLTWADARCEATRDGWHFTLPVPERTNALWRQYAGRTIVSAKHRADKQTAPRRFGCEPLRGDVAVRMVWVRARRTGDVDSRIKATLDLLNGVAWLDDAQVADLQVLRVDDDTQPARVEVFVWPIDTERVVA